MNIGDKIRQVRTIKGLSQENIADLLGISSIAYGDIERNKTDVSFSRLEQIAKALQTTIVDILSVGERTINYFSGNSDKNISVMNGNYYETKELQHQNEKLQLENKLLQSEKEKAEIQVKYYQEKDENKGK